MPESMPTAAGLTLREWLPEDAGDLVRIYQEPAMRHWIRNRPGTHDAALTWVADQREGCRTGDRFSFAVLDAGRLAGCVVLKQRREVGYWTAALARGRGIASRAVAAVTDWAVTTLDVAELRLRHQVDNEASCRVAHKAGYRLAATLPATPPFPLNGHLHVFSHRAGR